MKIVAQERSGKNEINLKFFKTKQNKKVLVSENENPTPILILKFDIGFGS